MITNTAPQMTPTATASQLAAAGSYALMVGDTEKAAVKYAEAGKILEAEAASFSKIAERSLNLYLAASQYYHGGHYEKALKLTNRIDVKHLTPDLREGFLSFRRAAKERASPDYAESMRNLLSTLNAKGRASDVLELLKTHQYVLNRAALARIRAYLCEELERYEAAAVFYADAVRFGKDDLALYVAAAALPIYWSLPQQAKLKQAWEYVGYLVKKLPHPCTLIAASLVCYHMAEQASEEERKKWTKQQFELAVEAHQLLKSLPLGEQQDVELRESMAFGFDVATIGLMKTGESGSAEKTFAIATEYGSNSELHSVVKEKLIKPIGQDSIDEQLIAASESHFYASIPTRMQFGELVGI